MAPFTESLLRGELREFKPKMSPACELLQIYLFRVTLTCQIDINKRFHAHFQRHFLGMIEAHHLSSGVTLLCRAAQFCGKSRMQKEIQFRYVVPFANERASENMRQESAAEKLI